MPILAVAITTLELEIAPIIIPVVVVTAAVIQVVGAIQVVEVIQVVVVEIQAVEVAAAEIQEAALEVAAKSQRISWYQIWVAAWRTLTDGDSQYTQLDINTEAIFHMTLLYIGRSLGILQWCMV